MNNDTDILNIHSQVCNYFENKIIKKCELKYRLSELEKTMQSTSENNKYRNEIQRSIEILKKNISNIENNEDYNFYIAETIEILEEYKNILKIPVKISFTGKCISNNNTKKEKILQDYFDIVQKYYNIKMVFPERKFKIECDNCGNKKDFSVEENSYICTICGCQQEIIHNITSYKDSDRVNISTKYTYDRKVHFRDCINQYQGKQNCTIETKVYDDLEDIIERHHLLLGKKNDNKELRFKNVSKEHIMMFLKELGYSKHYENLILIHYNLTGKKPDDISYLEDKLLNDFDLLVETYDKHFKNKVERVNFISTQYVLFQLLQKYKHPCKKEDFVILKTMDRKSFHDTICKELFSILNWSFVPLY
jgi:hypothetical protein